MDNDDQHLTDLVDTLTVPHNIQRRLGMYAAPTPQPEAIQSQNQQMSDSTLIALIGQKMSSSHQWFGSGKMASQRMKADQYYRGDPLGNELVGRSQVVSRDVAEAVDSLMPNLIRIFASGDQVVVMEPSRPDAEEAAKQATDYLNWTFLQQNEGFQVLYTWFKDALLKRNGIVMAWYETRTSRKKDEYEGLTEGQYQSIKSDPSIEILQMNPYPDPASVPQPMMGPMGPMIDPHTGQPAMQPPAMLYDCTIMSAQPVKKLIVENVPPDEFVIERRAASLDSASFMARRRKMALSDLIELGFDKDTVMNIPQGDDQDFTQERIERFGDEDDLPFGTEGDNLDKTMRKVWISETYLRVDYDGDGVAEWRKVTMAGDNALAGTTILDNEEVDDHPFSALTPIPDPHRFYGYSLYDQTNDIQDIKTALLRGALDSIYLANSPRLGAVEGQVNFDDLLDSRVGGVVRMKNPNAVVPLPTVNAAPQAFEMIEYMDQVREKRTGVSVATSGIDPNILNSSATGASIINNNQQQRAELIARVFAETGVKNLFRRIFELTCTHEDRSKTVRLRGKWVDIDPREWKDRMDVTVSVGVGLGNRNEKMAAISALLNVDKEIVQLQGGLQGPLLTAKNLFNKLEKLTEAAGFKSVEPYYQDPETAPPPPPKPPDPQLQIEQMRLQIENMKMQNEQNRLSIEHSGDQLEAQTELQKTKMDNETKIVVAQIAAKASLKQTQITNSLDPAKVHDPAWSGAPMGDGAKPEPSLEGLIDTVVTQLQASLAGVQQSHQQLAAAIGKPKKIISDAEGNITGVE